MIFFSFSALAVALASPGAPKAAAAAALPPGRLFRGNQGEIPPHKKAAAGGVVFRGQLLGPRLATPPFVLADWYWDS